MRNWVTEHFGFILVVSVVFAVVCVFVPKNPKNYDRITYSQIAEYKYVGSEIRDVYHKPDCKWAKKIASSNLVGYKNRENAEKSGKSPCKVCGP